MNFETIIGLEVHVELKTDSKIFSPSAAHFGSEPNSNTNEIDWAYPGTLPVLNKQAIEFGMKAALALNCDIHKSNSFDRKHYFYPDNPKAYQISQDEWPIGHDGWIEIEVEGKKKKLRIERIHLEEDAGKNTHGEDGYSYVDLNRQGSALIEIVSEADMRSPEEAYAFLDALKQILQYTGVSDVKMEEGSMRCDANVSLRPFGQEEFGTKTEIKNLNSFNFVRKGIAFEQARQEKILLSGGSIQQQTRRYDETTSETVLMRVKGEASDYRFFPEPDLPPLSISNEWIEEVRATLPEMPVERQQRYVSELGLPESDATMLTATKEFADFFEETIQKGSDPKLSSNWLMGDVTGYLKSEQKHLSETGLTPENLSQMIQLIEDGTISSKIGKRVFKELIEHGGNPKQLVEEKGWAQLSDPSKLRPIITEILDKNEQSIEDYKNGKDRALGFLVGNIMKQTRGQANPKVVNELLLEELNKR